MNTPLPRLGAKVRVDAGGPLGVTTNKCFQDGHWMLKVQFEDGTVKWHKQCALSPAE